MRKANDEESKDPVFTLRKQGKGRRVEAVTLETLEQGKRHSHCETLGVDLTTRRESIFCVVVFNPFQPFSLRRDLTTQTPV